MVKISKIDKKFERRKAQRHPCTEVIFFASRSGFHEGQCKDYSRDGLFIQTSEILSVGEIITVAIPFSDRMDDKRNAQIMWKNAAGFGVALFEKRNGANPKIVRLQRRVGNGSNLF
jgi:flagellar basal body L-ring protein FlgH